MAYIFRKANDGVFLATLEKLITSFGAIGTNEANILRPVEYGSHSIISQPAAAVRSDSDVAFSVF